MRVWSRLDPGEYERVVEMGVPMTHRRIDLNLNEGRELWDR